MARRSALMGVDRLLYFTDAIVAIAATLLILPLVDAAVGFQHAHPQGSTVEFLTEARSSLIALAVSLAVIARLWFAHHRVFGNVSRADAPLAALDLLWAFTIVFLPLPTQLAIQSTSSDQGAIALYIGTMLVASVLLMLITLRLRAHPELHHGAPPPHLSPSVATVALFVVALLLGTYTPLSYYALLLLLLSDVVERLIRPRLDTDTDTDTDTVTAAPEKD